MREASAIQRADALPGLVLSLPSDLARPAGAGGRGPRLRRPDYARAAPRSGKRSERQAVAQSVGPMAK